MGSRFSQDVLPMDSPPLFWGSGAIQEAVESLTGKSESEFFQRYVAGDDNLPFDEYLVFLGMGIDKAGVHSTVNASTQQHNQRRAWLQAGNAP
jgi:hypothetical protein